MLKILVSYLQYFLFTCSIELYQLSNETKEKIYNNEILFHKPTEKLNLINTLSNSLIDLAGHQCKCPKKLKKSFKYNC